LLYLRIKFDGSLIYLGLFSQIQLNTCLLFAIYILISIETGFPLMENKQVRANQMMGKKAVHYISHELLKNNIITAYPDVDLNGADMLAIIDIKDGMRFARIQSKGVTLKNKKKSRTIEIPRSYVDGTFTLLVYIEYLEDNSEHLLWFFAKDIKDRPDLWKKKTKKQTEKKIFSLTLYGNTFKNKFDLFKLTPSRITALKKIIIESEDGREFHYGFAKVEGILPNLKIEASCTGNTLPLSSQIKK